MYLPVKKVYLFDAFHYSSIILLSTFMEFFYFPP